MVTFNQSMKNKTVQQISSTEPMGNPQEAFRVAVAFEEGVNQHKTFEVDQEKQNKSQ